MKSLSKLRTFPAVSFICVVALWQLVACGKKGAEAWKPKPAKLERVDLLDVITQTGEVYPTVKIELRSEASGRVEKLYVNEGQMVNAGDTILFIDASRLQFRKQTLLLDLKKAQIQAQKSNRNWKQAQTLLTTGTISQKQLDDLKDDHELSELSYEQQKLDLKDLQDQLSKTVITAPMKGLLTTLGVEEGEIVVSATSGSQAGTSVATLADISRLEVRSQIGEVDYVNLSLGQKVKIKPEARQGDGTDGTITFISQSAKKVKDGELGTFEVRISVDSVIPGIVPGINVNVEFVLLEKKNVLGLPYAFVTRQDRGGKVMVPGPDGKPQEKSIKLGKTDYRYYEVLGGLQEGDEVLPPESFKTEEKKARFPGGKKGP